MILNRFFKYHADYQTLDFSTLAFQILVTGVGSGYASSFNKWKQKIVVVAVGDA